MYTGIKPLNLNVIRKAQNPKSKLSFRANGRQANQGTLSTSPLIDSPTSASGPSAASLPSLRELLNQNQLNTVNGIATQINQIKHLKTQQDNLDRQYQMISRYLLQADQPNQPNRAQINARLQSIEDLQAQRLIQLVQQASRLLDNITTTAITNANNQNAFRFILSNQKENVGNEAQKIIGNLQDKIDMLNGRKEMQQSDIEGNSPGIQADIRQNVQGLDRQITQLQEQKNNLNQKVEALQAAINP